MSTAIAVAAQLDLCAACAGNMSIPRICKGYGRDLANYGCIYQVVCRVLGLLLWAILTCWLVFQLQELCLA